MVDEVLVVQGGRLIDGTGRSPIENSVIVIRGGRFQTVGRSGEVSVPANAQVIDVKGKTVLPAFFPASSTVMATWRISTASSISI